MSLTLSARNAVLPTLLPGTVYIALHTGNPGDSATANEMVDGSYARQPTTFNVNTGTGTAASSLVLNFSLTSSHTITHISIWSSATGGAAVDRQPLTAPTDVTSGTFTIAAGDITLGGVS